jgi:hypothetical protein
MERKPWYYKGLQFSCTQCGNCCRNHGEYAYVYLTERELQAIPAYLGLSRKDFVARYCVKEEGSWHSLRMDAPACPFLGEDSRCAIYPVRPVQCRTWPFWEENLKRATWEGPVRACCPGIDQGQHYSREEVERLARETEECFE